MPSFRVTLAIGGLRQAVEPAAVLPAAIAAVRGLATVEAGDLQVVSGQARIVVRFTGDTTEHALRIGGLAASATGEYATVLSWRVTERIGGRWYPVAV